MTAGFRRNPPAQFAYEAAMTAAKTPEMKLHVPKGYKPDAGDNSASQFLAAERDRLVQENRKLETQRDELLAAVEWIVTDAVYKPPECYSMPEFTSRWVERARAALKSVRGKE